MERKIKEGTKMLAYCFQEEFQYLSNLQFEKGTKRNTKSHTNLLSEPFVELLAAIKHKTFSL